MRRSIAHLNANSASHLPASGANGVRVRRGGKQSETPKFDPFHHLRAGKIIALPVKFLDSRDIIPAKFPFTEGEFYAANFACLTQRADSVELSHRAATVGCTGARHNPGNRYRQQWCGS